MAKEPFAARLTCIWIGGFFLWMFRGFKGSLVEMFVKKNEKKNFRIGYIAAIVFFSIGIVLVVLKLMRDQSA